MKHARILLLSLFACGPSAVETTGPLQDVELTCTVQANNVLRYDCSAVLDNPSPLTVSIWEGRTLLRRQPAFDVSLNHSFVAYGMPPEAGIQISVESDDGHTGLVAVQTGPLPDTFTADVRVTGAASLPYLLTLDPCADGGALLVMDPKGRVHWYEHLGDAVFSGAGGPIDAFALTDRGSVLVVTGKSRLRELTFQGDVRTDLSLENGDFPRYLHHDLHWCDDYLYALNAEVHDIDGTQIVVDGVTVFDRDFAVVAEFDLLDHGAPQASGALFSAYWATVFPNSEDWSHGNSVRREGDSLLLSFRALDAIFDVVADPLDPNFGEVNSILTGTDTSPFASDFTWVDGPLGQGFAGQHHVSMAADGTLVVFDNSEVGPVSSGIRVALGGGQAELVQRWDFNRMCPVQGAVFPMEGGALLTCGDGRFATWMDDDSIQSWRMTFECPDGVQGPLSRVVPLFSF